MAVLIEHFWALLLRALFREEQRLSLVDAASKRHSSVKCLLLTVITFVPAMLARSPCPFPVLVPARPSVARLLGA